MTIEIPRRILGGQNPEATQATGFGSVEEVLLHLLDTQEEQDRRLLENRY